MGLFLAMSGIAESNETEVQQALHTYTSERLGVFEPVSSSDSSDTFEPLIIAESDRHHVSVVYPHDFFAWNEASLYLSITLNKPVFSFHIHDGDLWMYILYVGGEEVDRFNPIPNYWAEVSEDERQDWKGEAKIVSRYWPGISENEIKNYLTEWTLEDEQYGVKAYSHDNYGFGEEWQLIDFLKKLGLIYPIEASGKATGNTFRLEVAEG